jgi:hypothetical protein
MDGDATAEKFPAAASFPDKSARSEYSEEDARGDPRATQPPPEKVRVDPPSPANRLSSSGRRAAVGLIHATPPSTFTDRRPDRSVRRRRRRSSLSAGTLGLGSRSKGGHPFADRSTLSRSASFEVQGPRYASSHRQGLHLGLIRVRFKPYLGLPLGFTCTLPCFCATIYVFIASFD